MEWENDIFNGLGLMAVQANDGSVSTGITARTVLTPTGITTPMLQQIKTFSPAPVIPITTPIAQPSMTPQIIQPPIQQPTTTQIVPNNNCTDCGGDTIHQTIAPGEPTPGSFDLMDWAKKNWWLLVIGAGATYLIMKKNRNNGN